MSEISEHAWPYPEPFEPGREYLWCPTASLDDMVEEGWEQTTQDHRYGGKRYTLLRRGEALGGVEPGTAVPDMFVLVPVDETPVESDEVREVKTEAEPPKRRGRPPKQQPQPQGEVVDLG